MSWAKDEWKAGLTAQALKKVSEYEESLERNRKELQQRQFQQDSLNAALQKQKLLTEEEKNNSNQYKRDSQVLSKKCDELTRTNAKVVAETQMKESKINCLNDQLSKEKQSLDNEIAKCNRFKVDLEVTTAKHDKLLGDFNKVKLQKDMQVGQVKHEEPKRNLSFQSSSDSETEREVFPAPRQTARIHTPQENGIGSGVKIRSCSSTSSNEEMKATNQASNQEARVKEMQKMIDGLKKEKTALSAKHQHSVSELDMCRSQLLAMEAKQKQLVQQIECSRHNVEATRRHQEEKMKEKEREYREEISTQNKALVQLEHELKEMKVKFEQDHHCSEAKIKELELVAKKTQIEKVAARETIMSLEHDQSQHHVLVTEYEKTVAELRHELGLMKQSKDTMETKQHENIKTIAMLNEVMEANKKVLDEKALLVTNLQESKEHILAEERVQFLEQIKQREVERDSVVGKLNEIEKTLEMSSLSSLEKENGFGSIVEKLTFEKEKCSALLEQREKELESSRLSLEEKDKELGNMTALLECRPDSEDVKKLSDEVSLFRGQLELSLKSCETLKSELKESEMKVSHVDAQYQMLQMDIEDKDELIAVLEQQKTQLELSNQEHLKQMSEYKENMNAAKEEVDNLHSKNGMLTNEANEAESHTGKLQEQLAELRNVLESLTLQKKELAEELHKTKEERDERYSAYDMKIEEFGAALKTTKDSLDTTERTVVGQLKEELANKDTMLQRRENEFSEMTVQFEAIQEEFDATKMKLCQVEQELACVSTNMNMIVDEKSKIASELKACALERDENVIVLGRLQAEVAEKEQLIQTLTVSRKEILAKQDTDVQTFEAKLKVLSEECHAKSVQITDQGQKYEELSAERERLRESIERLRGEVLEVDQERQKYTVQRKEHEETCAEYKTTIGKLEIDLSDVLEQGQKDRAQFEERCSKFKQDLIVSKSDGEQQKSLVEEMRSNLEGLQSEKESLAVDNERLIKENTSCLQQIEEVNGRCEEYKKKLREQEDVLGECRFNCEQLASELAKTKQLSEAIQIKLNEDINQLKEMVNRGKDELCSSQKELENQLAVMNDMNAEKTRLESALESVKSEKNSISGQYKNVLIENGIFAQKLAASEQEKVDGVSDVERLQKEIEIIQNKSESSVKVLHDDIQNLRSELIHEKEKHNETKAVLTEKEVVVKELKNARESLEVEVESIGSEREAVLEKLKRTVEESKDLTEQLNVSKGQLMEYKAKVEDMEQEVMGINNAFQATEAKLQESLLNARNEMVHGKQHLESLKQAQGEMEVAFHSLQDDKAALEFQIQTMASEKQAIAEKYEGHVQESRVSKERVSQIEQASDELKIKVENLEHELAHAHSEMTSVKNVFKSEMENVRSELEQEKMKIARMEDEVGVKETEIKLLTDEKESLLFEIETLKTVQESLSEKIATITEEKRICFEKSSVSEQQVSELSVIIENLQNDLKIANEGAENTQTTLDDKVQSLHDELTNTKEKLTTVLSYLKEKETALQTVMVERETLLFEIANMREQEKLALEKCEQHENESEITSEKLVAMEQHVAEQKLLVEQLQKDLSDAKYLSDTMEVTNAQTLEKFQLELKKEKDSVETTVATLKEQYVLIQALSSEKETLLFQIDNMDQEKQKHQEQLNLALDENKNIEEKLRESEEQRSKTKIDEENVTRQLSEMQVMQDLNESTQANLQARIERLESELATAQEKLQKALREVKERETTAQLLAKEKESLVFELELIKTEKKDALDKIETFSSENNLHLKKLSTSEEQIAEYKQVVGKLEVEVCEVRQIRDELEQRRVSLEHDVENLKNKVEVKQEELMKARSDVEESKTLASNMNIEKDAMKLAIEQLKSENVLISEKLDITKEQCNAYENRLSESDKLFSDYNTKESLISDLKEQLRLKESKLGEVAVEVENVKVESGREIEDLKGVVAQKDDSLGEKACEINELKTKIEMQNEQIKQREMKCETEEERNTLKVEELEKRIKELREEGEEKGKEAREAKDRIEFLKRELETKIDEARVIEGDFEKERNQMLEQIKVAGQDLQEIQRNVDSKIERITLLETQLMENSTSKEREHYEAMSTAREEKDTLNEKIRQSATENNELRDKLKTLQEEFEQQLRSKDEGLLNLDCMLEKSREHQLNVETENRKRVQQLEGELLKEKEKVTYSCRRIDELLSNARDEHDVMESAAREFGKVRSELEGEIKSLKDKLEKQERNLVEYHALEQEYEQVKVELQKAREDAEKLGQTIATLQDSLHEVTLEKESVQGELTKSLDAQRLVEHSAMDKEVELEATVDRYKSEIEDIQSKLDDHVRASEATSALLQQKEGELSDSKKELHSKSCDVERLETTCETARETEAELRHRLDELSRDMENNQQQEGDVTKELCDAKRKMKMLEEQLEEKTAKLEEEREEIVAKTKEFVLARENEYAEKAYELEQELLKKDQLLVSKREEIHQLTYRLETEQKSKEILMSEIEDREQEIVQETEANIGKKSLSTPRKLRAIEAELEEERKTSKGLQERCQLLDDLVMSEQNKYFALERKLKCLEEETHNMEEKEEEVDALKSEVRVITEQVECVRRELNDQVNDSVVLKNVLEKVKERAVTLEERLQEQVKVNEMLKKDNEQANEKTKQVKNEPFVAYEEANSMKVCELEYCIDKLKKDLVKEESKSSHAEETLQHAVEETSTLQGKLSESLSENELLRERLKENANKVTCLEQKISELEERLSKEENANHTEMTRLKEEMKTQVEEIDGLKQKLNQLHVTLDEKTASLASKEQARQDFEQELVVARKSADEASSNVLGLKEELKQAKSSLESARKELKFLETMKEEVFVVEEKCATWRSKCAEVENKLQEEKHSFEQERKALEEKIKSVTSSYNDTKDKLEDLEEERKPMADRLLQLEGEMIMMPNIDKLKTQLDVLEKELQNEKENTSKYEKLSKEYYQKLNELTNSKDGGPVKKTPSSLQLLKTPLEVPKQAVKQKEQELVKNDDPATTPTLMDEQQVFLSPITRSMSNLGFTTPARPKVEVKKSASRITRPSTIRRIPKSASRITQPPKTLTTTGQLPKTKELETETSERVNNGVKNVAASSCKAPTTTQSEPTTTASDGDITSALDAGIKKRKVLARQEQSPKRMKLSSPFVLQRQDGVKTRSRASGLQQQSRLAQPRTRTQLQEGRSRIPKRTSGKLATANAASTTSKIPKSKPSGEECKMQ